MNRDQGWAETIETRIILVAARLIDHPLAAELGFERLHRDAVRFNPAIPTALADEFIDEDPLWRIRQFLLFAAAAFFCRAGLIVNQHRNAGRCRELALHMIEFMAVLDHEPFRPMCASRI